MSLLDSLENEPEEWHEEDRAELEQILRGPTIRKALQYLMMEAKARAGQAMGINLTDPQNALLQLAQMQGTVAGLRGAVERLVEMSQKEETNDARE